MLSCGLGSIVFFLNPLWSLTVWINQPIVFC